MMKLSLLCTTVAVGLALSACGGVEGVQTEMKSGLELAKTTGMTPTGSAFDRALFSEYLTLSRNEYNQGDYIDSDAYALRARAAGQGNLVQPEEVSARKEPADKVPELSSSRGRLVAALNAGARDRAPREAAQAQAMFDCWMEQQEENRQPADIAACRSGFMTALAKIETPSVAAAPRSQGETFTVYFDNNKSGLNAKARSEVERIVARARAINARSVAVEGYTDRSGSAPYNLRLSQKREAAVHDAIHQAGLNTTITGQSYGEDKPAVQTADNLSEPRNRRVVVTLAP